MIIINDPNTLIPREYREYLDPRPSSDIIDKFIRENLEKTGTLQKNQKMEIEAKIGYVIKGNNLFLEDSKPLIISLSDRDHIIIGCSKKEFINEAYHCYDWISHNYKLEKSDTMITFKKYYNLLNYFKYHSQLFALKKGILEIIEGKDSLTVDLILQDKNRLTLDFLEKKWIIINKQKKENLDIFHRNNAFRISCSVENELQYDPNQPIAGVKMLRIKNRKSFIYQYMRYDFTEVINLAYDDQDPLKLKHFHELSVKLSDNLI